MEKRGEDQEFPSKLSFVSQSRKFSLGIHYCCNNFAYRKSLEKRRRGSIKTFRQKLLSHTAENLRKEYFIVALISCTEKVWKRGGGGEYQDSPSKFFCLTVSKISVGESFTVALISGGERVYGQEGGRKHQDFPSEKFSLTPPKISVGNPLLLD